MIFLNKKAGEITALIAPIEIRDDNGVSEDQ